MTELPRIHPRRAIKDAAEKELYVYFWNWLESHDITYGETLQIMAKLLKDLAGVQTQQERKAAEEQQEFIERIARDG